MENKNDEIKEKIILLTNEIDEKIKQKALLEQQLKEDQNEEVEVVNLKMNNRKKDKYPPIVTVEEILNTTKKIFHEAYELQLRRIPKRLVEFEEPKTDFMILLFYLNNVVEPLFGGRLRSNDPQLLDKSSYWHKVWYGLCGVLKNHLIPNQNFIVESMERSENPKFPGIFTLTTKIKIFLTEKERNRLNNHIDDLKRQRQKNFTNKSPPQKEETVQEAVVEPQPEEKVQEAVIEPQEGEENQPEETNQDEDENQQEETNQDENQPEETNQDEN